MKTISKKQATKSAYMLICSRHSIIMKEYNNLSKFRKKLDFRFTQNRLIYSEICRLSKLLDFEQIAKKQKLRAINKLIEMPVNYLNSSLYLDYKTHKNDVLRINDNYIQFRYGRNHHAKNQNDIIILSILKKNVNNGN